MTVKHLHTVNVPESDQCGAVSAFILSEYFEPRLPRLVAHCAEHWPVNCSFRLVLETFLSYVQPWRYRASINQPTRLSDDPAEARLWAKFVADNLNCYRVNFGQLIRRMLRVKLSQGNTEYFNLGFDVLIY